MCPRFATEIKGERLFSFFVRKKHRRSSDSNKRFAFLVELATPNVGVQKKKTKIGHSCVRM